MSEPYVYPLEATDDQRRILSFHSRTPYLWIGDDEPNRKACFGVLSGYALYSMLKRLAAAKGYKLVKVK